MGNWVIIRISDVIRYSARLFFENKNLILLLPMQLQIRGEVEADKDQEKKRAVNVATRSLERDLERLKADHATEIEQMLERHKQELSDNKKKQWVRFEFYAAFFFV